MSGIVGILNRDGAPVDREKLTEMTRVMAFRGPDAQEVWVGGEVGFGHTLLRTTWESERERQPCTLDGQVWITADVRIDGREDLIHELQAAGRHPTKDATDPELILHAWHAWDERCLERLLGDFAFAIWDGRVRRLFCARDHFGIKLLYYSQAGGDFIFSNTLKCVRLSPAVSSKLNDAAIAEFLLFGHKQNPSTTSFCDIQRLPAAHYLVWSERHFEVRQYWSLPVEGPLYYKRAEDYVEHFKHLLRSAVSDRLRTDRIGVFMSGGLDSPALAATAREILAARPSSYDLRAYTVVFDRLIPDDERHYAGLVADMLGIPIHFLAADGYGFYERWEQPELHTPEPSHRPISLTIGFDQYVQASAHCRVMLYGEGPDNAMSYEWQPYFLNQLKTLRWGQLLRDLSWHARFHREVPLVASLRNRLRRLRTKGTVQPPHPKWIHPEMLKLATRGEPSAGKPQTVHPFHPAGYTSLTQPLWHAVFEGFDAGSTSFPIEVRHPYMDIRVIRYLLALPPIPWCRRKYLIRRSFRGALPDTILGRPKTPVQADQWLACAKASGLPQWVPEPSLFRFVDPEVVNNVLIDSVLTDVPGALWRSLTPVSLNFFLAFEEQTVRRCLGRGVTDDAS